MAKILNVKGMERLNEISTKYKFQDDFELEQEDITPFCRAIKQAWQLGLSVEEEDLNFIDQVLDEFDLGY